MKNLCVRHLFTLLLAAAPLALHAESNVKIVFKAPFSFVAGSRTLPAGTYQVSESDDHILLIQSTTIQSSGDSLAAALVVYPVAEGGMGGRVNFVRRGGVYYLNTLQIGDGRIVRVPGQPGEK
jgi:hypothetical protein